jgi:hypothetical protein
LNVTFAEARVEPLAALEVGELVAHPPLRVDLAVEVLRVLLAGVVAVAGPP